MWREVKILIIDELYFMRDDQFQELSRKLQTLLDRHRSFGGLLLKSAADFRQLDPCGEKQPQLLFSRESSRIWDSVNKTISLNNEQRFKDDPEYGRMTKILWKSDLSTKDHRKIDKSRVVQECGLKLPREFNGNACYAYPSSCK